MIKAIYLMVSNFYRKKWPKYDPDVLAFSFVIMIISFNLTSIYIVFRVFKFLNFNINTIFILVLSAILALLVIYLLKINLRKWLNVVCVNIYIITSIVGMIMLAILAKNILAN